MNHKDRILKTLKGEPVDKIPWAPRLDLWYKANRRADTLPPQYRGADIFEIIDGLNAGYHAVVPDFKNLRTPADDVDRALGIYNLKTMPYSTALENISRKVTYNGDETIVEYHTPVGNIRTKVIYDENMRKAGVTVTHISEHAIKSAGDYKAAGYIFRNAKVIPNYEGYLEFSNLVGERGLAVAFISLAGSPMHLLQRELMPLEFFFYELYDHPDELIECAEEIRRYFENIFKVVIDCQADIIFLGANYDSSVTCPPFFEKHILPTLKSLGQKLHKRGKFLLTHTDGENTGLLDFYMKSEIDIADSICSYPMTKLSFKQIRDHFGGKITIWGGIPSIALLENSMSDYDFEVYLDKFFSTLNSGDHLILGISDTTPPGAKFERLKKIGNLIEEFGPVTPEGDS